MARSLARDAAMKLIYAQMLGGDGGEETLTDLIAFKPTQDDRRYLEETVSSVLREKDRIDALIEKYLVNWTLERLSRVDLSILRLAVYELVFRKDIPAAVAINEAVELSHIYSTEESGSFINGVLGNLNRSEKALV